ncbi:hypothetical protein E4U32_003639 [Claviceps aff. humidiphila group G2b]|nr:hypothetical protein E4U32_003639 [Claviceps aff. humidiphila group G2b]
MAARNNQNEALLRRERNELPTIRSSLTQTSFLLFIMSYADVAASGPKQTPEEAAAPQPVEIVNTESVATASPLDVDIRSVHTVPSEFSEISEQPIQTETQANRLDFKTEADVEAEAEAAKTTKAKDKAKGKVQNAKKQTETKARETDSWLVQQFSGLSDGSASALAVTNLVAIIGVSSYLGYKAWGLYERGNLSWKTAGVGVGILAGVGAAEAVLGRYLYKGKKGGS